MRLTSETFNRVARAALFGVAVLAATSCGEVARTGQSPVYLDHRYARGRVGCESEHVRHHPVV